jgi:hypothetical protein
VFEEVAAYLVLAPILGAVLTAVALIGWGRQPGVAAVNVEKERQLSD